MAWNDFSNMPWMQTSKPGEMLLKGAEVGSGIAANINRSRGLQLQAEEQSVLNPLKAQLMQTEVAKQALDLSTAKSAQEYDTQGKAGVAKIAELMTKIPGLEGGWSNPDVPGWLGQIGVEAPAVTRQPIWATALQNFKDASKLKADVEYHKATIAQRDRAAKAKTDAETIKAKARNPEGLSPGDVKVFKDDTGSPIGVKGIYDGNHYYMVKDADKSQVEAIRTANALTGVHKTLGDLGPSADPVAVGQLKATAKMLSQKLSQMLAGFPKQDAPTGLAAPSAPSAAAPTAPATEMPSRPMRVTSKEQRDALPKGTQYIGPDGNTYVKQ